MILHGTIEKYNEGCRCPLCLLAKISYDFNNKNKSQKKKNDK
jgi:hypothetical protein